MCDSQRSGVFRSRTRWRCCDRVAEAYGIERYIERKSAQWQLQGTCWASDNTRRFRTSLARVNRRSWCSLMTLVTCRSRLPHCRRPPSRVIITIVFLVSPCPPPPRSHGRLALHPLGGRTVIPVFAVIVAVSGLPSPSSSCHRIGHRPRCYPHPCPRPHHLRPLPRHCRNFTCRCGPCLVAFTMVLAVAVADCLLLLKDC